MWVASYCRVSTDHTDQANSFASQQRYFRAYIEHHPDWQLYGVYADEGITGTSTKMRTEFNRMLHDAKAGKFQMILTKEISRFSRNILDTITYTRELRSIGVGVLFLAENLNTLRPESEMLLTFLGTIAQEESRRTSLRVKWGQTRRMEQGFVFGPSLLGYDVRNGSLTINPQGADLVRLIFRKYGLERKDASVIARELGEMGCRTANGSPNWTASHIVKILKNEKYVGDLVQKKTITQDYLTHAKKANRGEEELVILKDHHEPIIPRPLWEAVQSELARRNRHCKDSIGHSNRHLFSGRIWCASCGASFVCRCKIQKDGTKLRRWSCYGAVSRGSKRTGDGGSGCGVGRLLRDDDAHQMLKQALQSLRLDRSAIISNVTKLAQDPIPAGEGGRRENLQHAHSQIQFKKRQLLDAYLCGDITREDMLSARSRCDAQLEDLCTHPDASMETFLMDVLSGKAESEVLYRLLVDHVTVFQDRHMELRLNHLPQVFWFI